MSFQSVIPWISTFQYIYLYYNKGIPIGGLICKVVWPNNLHIYTFLSQKIGSIYGDHLFMASEYGIAYNHTFHIAKHTWKSSDYTIINKWYR